MPDKQVVSNKSLKVIDINSKEFVANGKTYYIESSLSFKRFLMYQKLQIECGYEVGFYGLYEKIKKIYELCDKMKFAEIAVLTHNIISGIAKVDERKIPALQLCALFINEKNEDRHIINDDIVDRKIADWEAEKLDILPFFQLAAISMKGFMDAYKEITQTTLENQKGITKKAN